MKRTAEPASHNHQIDHHALTVVDKRTRHDDYGHNIGAEEQPHVFDAKQDYSNFGQPTKGQVLIISNHEFKSLETRHGTDQDCNRLRNLFKTLLNYNVTIEYNLTSEQMKNVVKEFSESKNHESAQSSFLFILSHGRGEGIYGVDDDVLVPLKELTSPFIHSVLLSGKPKIIFVQACRFYGKPTRSPSMSRFGVPIEHDSTAEEQAFNDSFWKSHLLYLEEAQKMSEGVVVPMQTDLFLSCSAMPNHPSFRNVDEGSWFIQDFVDVVNEHALYDDICSIMIKVNNKTGERIKKDPPFTSFRQYPESTCRLRLKFYFFPGINERPSSSEAVELTRSKLSPYVSAVSSSQETENNDHAEEMDISINSE